jgi:thiol-disulfide isomerase/thioredoxin
MKKILLISLLSLIMAACGTGQAGETLEATGLEVLDNAKVTVFYFHGKQRCVTCVTLQEVTQQAVAENFRGNPDVQFVEVDVSEKENQALADKYEIVFSSLVIATSNNHLDISQEAFDLVMAQPETLKALIVQVVNARL